MCRMPAAASLVDKRAKKSPAPWSLMARSASGPAKPCQRDRPRRARDGARDRLLRQCTPGASSGCRRVSALACPRTSSQRGVRGLWARGGGRPPSAQRGWLASCHWHAPRQYTKTRGLLPVALTRGIERHRRVRDHLPARSSAAEAVAMRPWDAPVGGGNQLHPRSRTMTVASWGACSSAASVGQSALPCAGRRAAQHALDQAELGEGIVGAGERVRPPVVAHGGPRRRARADSGFGVALYGQMPSAPPPPARRRDSTRRALHERTRRMPGARDSPRPERGSCSASPVAKRSVARSALASNWFKAARTIPGDRPRPSCARATSLSSGTNAAAAGPLPQTSASTIDTQPPASTDTS